jgi:hypothetical protein
MIQFTPQMPKKPNELLNLSMDFSQKGWLKSGETIAACVWSAQVYSGSDPTPDAMISGAATITGTEVFQDVTGGIEGTVYLLLATITTNTGRTLVGRALLRVATV